MIIAQVFSQARRNARSKISKPRNIFSSPPPSKNLSHIMERLICHLISLCLSNIYVCIQPIVPRYPRKVKIVAEHVQRTSSVCTDSSFSICSDFHGIRFIFAFATRCVVTACDDRHERVTACHLPNWQTLLSTSRGGKRRRSSSIGRIDIRRTQLARYRSSENSTGFRVWRPRIAININNNKNKQ